MATPWVRIVLSPGLKRMYSIHGWQKGKRSKRFTYAPPTTVTPTDQPPNHSHLSCEIGCYYRVGMPERQGPSWITSSEFMSHGPTAFARNGTRSAAEGSVPISLASSTIWHGNIFSALGLPSVYRPGEYYVLPHRREALAAHSLECKTSIRRLLPIL